MTCLHLSFEFNYALLILFMVIIFQETIQDDNYEQVKEKDTRMKVEVKPYGSNKTRTFNIDLTTQELDYNDGDRLNFECYSFNQTSNAFTWHHIKNNIILFSQTKAVSRASIELDMSSIDHDSKLICRDYKNISAITLRLKMNEPKSVSMDEDRESGEKKYHVHLGHTLDTKCKSEDQVMYGLLSNNVLIKTNDTQYTFNLKKDHNGIKFFCVEYDNVRNTRVIVPQNHSLYSPGPMEFREGQKITYTCYHTNEIQAQWILKKDGVPVFIGSNSYNSYSVSMSMYYFDDNSTLFCESKEYSVAIPLILNKRLSPVVKTKVEEIINDSDNLIKCDNESVAIQQDGHVITGQSHFQISEECDEMTVYCYEKIKDLNNCTDTRLVDFVKVIKIKGPSLFLPVVGALVVIVIVSAVTLIACRCVKRRRIQDRERSNNNGHTEPVYATPQVIYAQLDLTTKERDRVPKNDDRACYAEILGVLTPKT